MKGAAGVAAADALRSWPMASSHGSAMAMLPVPRRTARRFKRNWDMNVTPSGAARVVEELVRLRQRDQHLLHVVPGLLERDLDRRRRALVAHAERAPVGKFEPVRSETHLR